MRLVHFDGLCAGVAVLKVQTVFVVVGARYVVARQRRHDLVLVVGGAGVLKADLPSVADRIDAVIQVVVQGNDVLPGAVVLGARRDVQVLDDVVILLDRVLRALGNISKILTGGAIFFQIATVEGLRAAADLAVEIFEQIVVFAQPTLEVLLGERRFAAILVIIVVQAVRIAEGL